MTDALIAVAIVLQLLVIALLLRPKAGKDKQVRVELERFSTQWEHTLDNEIRRLREDSQQSAKLGREEIANNFQRLFTQLSQTVSQNFTAQNAHQNSLLESFSTQLRNLTDMNEQKLERVRNVVEERLAKLQEDNAKKLEQMRQTVDEKLNATLEQRLSASFQQVSERLEAVHKGLGEMQSLAHNVGDLKRVLTNVKTRGTFGEVQLERLLEQILSPEQYAKNVSTKSQSSDRVEFAIRLPGRTDAEGTVYLPIDCKFPLEDYQRMLDAEEAGDVTSFQESAKALQVRIKAEAKSIASKYLDPPHTTDFAILYLPIEGLFAEVLRHSGLAEELQQAYRVVLAGPTTLTALLNSLQMGFRTMAIQQRSSEVWALLGAIKTQFGTFGDLLKKTQKKLREASNSIDTAAQKSRSIERRLKAVEELPTADALALVPELGAEGAGIDDEADAEE